MHRPILIAIDGGARSQALLATAAHFAQPARHCLNVLLAVDISYALPLHDGRISAFDLREYPAASEQEREAQRAMARALDYLHGLGFTADGALVAGDPAQAIIAEARRQACELVVMGHRHLSRLGRLLDPSISHDVLEGCHCPVLITACPT